MLVDFDFAKTINDINDSKSGGELVNDRLPSISPSTSSDTEVRVPDINTELATTESDGDIIWTVSGLLIHAYTNTQFNTTFPREPHPLLQSTP